MKFRSVISRSVLAAGVTASLLLSLACQKRAALMVRGRDSSASSAYFRVASPGVGGGGGDRHEDREMLRLVAEQTEATWRLLGYTLKTVVFRIIPLAPSIIL